MSKRSEAIEVMKANADKAMAEVVTLIAERIGVTEGNAKSYYKWIVQHGMAPGEIVKTARQKTVTRLAKEAKAKAPKTAKPKLVKVPKPRVAGDKEAAEKAKLGKEKTAEEIADIRAKNLQRLKAVGQKYARGQYAEGKKGGFTPAEAQEARDYVEAVTNDLDSFKSPTFLNMDQVRALV